MFFTCRGTFIYYIVDRMCQLVQDISISLDYNEGVYIYPQQYVHVLQSKQEVQLRNSIQHY